MQFHIRRRYILPLFLAGMLANASSVSAQFGQTPNGRVNQQRGATLGGLAGAVAGGLIGDNNGEAGAGAAIGGVIGAVTGGLLGNAADKENVIRSQQQNYVQQQQQYAIDQSAVSINDVVSMSRSGLSDGVIINQVQSRGVITELQVPDIIALHQQGVSETVISAMQRAPTGNQRVARAVVPQPVQVQPVYSAPPVIVQEHVVLPHYPPPRVYHHYRGRRPVRHQSGVHIRF